MLSKYFTEVHKWSNIKENKMRNSLPLGQKTSEIKQLAWRERQGEGKQGGWRREDCNMCLMP